MRIRPLVWITLPTLIALLTFWAVAFRAADGSLERLRNAGVVRVGYAVEPPYAMIGADGRITGEAPETARAVLDRLGFERIEWVQLSFTMLIPELVDRRLDVVAAGLFVTRERQRLVRLSDPTVRAAPGVLVRRGNPQDVSSFSKLSPQGGYTVAVLADSVEERRLLSRGFTDADLIRAPDVYAGRAAVAEGVVDAVALSAPALRWAARSSPEAYEVILEADDVAAALADEVAFAFHPDDAELARAWNEVQAGYLGTPEHLRSIAPFGFGAKDLARPAPSDEAGEQ